MTEHAHDWPLLSVFVIGGYSNQTEIGENLIEGPSAVLYRDRASHRNIAGPDGFEQIEIEFDPAFLGRALIPDIPVAQWVGARAGAASRSLIRLCQHEKDEEQFRTALQRFVACALAETKCDPPCWTRAITQRLREDATMGAAALAKEIGRHPSWMGTAYKRATGEALPQTAARIRVEKAARMLRESDLPPAAIAAEAGFCDQSHMNRTFRRVLGRLPTEVRKDSSEFRQELDWATPAPAV